MRNNFRKILAYGWKLLFSVLILTACSGNTPGEEGLEKHSSDTSADRTATTAEQTVSETGEQIITIKLGFSTDETDPRAVAASEFEKIVERESEGSIHVELYPNGRLGADKALIMGIVEGEVDMTVSSAGNFANFANVGVSAFPFLFENFDEAWEFMDSPLVAEINEDIKEYNIHVLAHFDNGFRCITTSESAGPIYSLADMKDLNIRTSSNQIVMETMTTLGAKPKALGFMQLYAALDAGEFEAQENPIPVIYNHNLFEVQKYLAITNHSYDAMPFVIREDLWNSMTAGQQEIIEQAAKEVEAFNREMNREQTETYEALLEEEGMVITHPDLSEFREASQAVYDYFAPFYGEELIERVFEQIGRR